MKAVSVAVKDSVVAFKLARVAALNIRSVVMAVKVVEDKYILGDNVLWKAVPC